MATIFWIHVACLHYKCWLFFLLVGTTGKLVFDPVNHLLNSLTSRRSLGVFHCLTFLMSCLYFCMIFFLFAYTFVHVRAFEFFEDSLFLLDESSILTQFSIYSCGNTRKVYKVHIFLNLSINQRYQILKESSKST